MKDLLLGGATGRPSHDPMDPMDPMDRGETFKPGHVEVRGSLLGEIPSHEGTAQVYGWFRMEKLIEMGRAMGYPEF